MRISWDLGRIHGVSKGLYNEDVMGVRFGFSRVSWDLAGFRKDLYAIYSTKYDYGVLIGGLKWD